MRKLRFYLNKELDKVMTEQFLYELGGGVNFGERIIQMHPQLKKVRMLDDEKQRNKLIRSYINRYYQTHKTDLLRSLGKARQAWQVQEEKFFKITQDFFEGYTFQKGKYIAYASIIDCNPRFLDTKTFQFFYKKSSDDVVYTIAHELLHFIFFDFVAKKMKQEIMRLSEDELWDLSEIFNVIILESPHFQNIINKKFLFPYPDHQHYIQKFRRIYKDSQNAQKFISAGIKTITKKK